MPISARSIKFNIPFLKRRNHFPIPFYKNSLEWEQNKFGVTVMLVNAEKINKFYNGVHVLQNVCLTIEDNDRIGLIGINGCGKSTFLRILTGQEQADVLTRPEEESLSITKGTVIGFLEQDSGLNRTGEIWEEMKTAFSPLLKTQDEMRALETEMSRLTDHQSQGFQEISDKYARLATYFETNGGYDIDYKIRTILNGMGFPPERDRDLIGNLSGGEKTRLALCRLLLEEPSLLILDEPTNHLDFSTIIWLEDYLKSYKGALMIVSHDRRFLDQLCTSIAEIELGKLTRYKGNYTAFVQQKEMAVARQLKEYEAQQEEIAKLQEYVDKNLVRASTTAMAQSRRRQLEKMERIERPVTHMKTARIEFTYATEPPKDVLTVERLDLVVGKGDGKKTLVQDVNFKILRGEKVAVAGDNGTGKSTLLKALQGLIARPRGYVEWAKNVRISYFEQENAHLNPHNTVIEELHSRYPAMTDLEVRSALGAVRLTGDNVYKKTSVISGGERAKLCFAIIMQEKSNVLLLDEPTNHLDMATREALEEALTRYTGTILFVSHDRYLMERLADRIIEVNDTGVQCFTGGFEGYMNAKRQIMQAERQVQEQQKKQQREEKTVKTYRSKEQRAADAKRKQQIRELENDIHRMEREIRILEEEMMLPEISKDYQEMMKRCEQTERLKQELSDITNTWITLSEEDS